MFKNLFSSGESWRKINLVNYATIDFPGKPQLNNSSKGLTAIGYNDKTNFYIAEVEDLSNYGLEVTSNELDDLYKGIIVGFFENPELKPLVKKEFKVDGLIGLEIIYSVNAQEVPNLRYKRLLFYNAKIFSIEFWTTFSNEKESEGNRERYFNSFTVTLDKSILKQFTIE